MKNTIVIADADEQFSNELVTALEDSIELEVVGVAADGEQAILMVKDLRPDILVMDPLLTQYDGLTVLERLRKTYFCPKVMMVSSFISNYVVATATRMGVQQIIRKPCSIDIIIKNLHAMATNAGEEPVIFLWNGEQNVPSLVTRILHDIGVPAHIKGYQYLREAIIIAVKDMDVCNAMEKVLYPRVAKVFHTTPRRVIRAMRHAITVIWRKSNHAIIEKYCGYLGGKPNPTQFIEALAEDVQWQLDKDK